MYVLEKNISINLGDVNKPGLSCTHLEILKVLGKVLEAEVVYKDKITACGTHDQFTAVRTQSHSH